MHPILETEESLQKNKDNFGIWDHPIEEGRHIPLHWHDYFEFELIVEGEVSHTCNGNTQILTAGCAHLMSPQDFHELTMHSYTHIYSLHFSKKILPPELLQTFDYHDLHFKFTPEESRYLENKFLRLIKEENEQLPFYKLNMVNIISEILIFALRKSQNSDSLNTPTPIQQAVIYINEHFQEQLSLNKMADALCFSPNYLGMLFKKHMNCSFNEYLNRLRLKYACNMLSSSNMSIREIAFSSGYSSVEYFTSTFKKTMLMTPNEYRKVN